MRDSARKQKSNQPTAPVRRIQEVAEIGAQTALPELSDMRQEKPTCSTLPRPSSWPLLNAPLGRSNEADGIHIPLGYTPHTSDYRAAERQQEGDRQNGGFVEQPLECVRGDLQQDTILVRHNVRATGTLIDQGDLAKGFTRSDGAQRDFFVIHQGQRPQFSFQNQIHRVAVLALADDVTELLAMEHLHVSNEGFNLAVVQTGETLHPAQRLRFHSQTTAAPVGLRPAGRRAFWWGAEHHLKLREVRSLPPTVVGLRINPLIAGHVFVRNPLDQACQIYGSGHDFVPSPHSIDRGLSCVFHPQFLPDCFAACFARQPPHSSFVGGSLPAREIYPTSTPRQAYSANASSTGSTVVPGVNARLASVLQWRANSHHTSRSPSQPHVVPNGRRSYPELGVVRPADCFTPLI